jgi:hypothetical protein
MSARAMAASSSTSPVTPRRHCRWPLRSDDMGAAAGAILASAAGSWAGYSACQAKSGVPNTPPPGPCPAATSRRP